MPSIRTQCVRRRYGALHGAPMGMLLAIRPVMGVSMRTAHVYVQPKEAAAQTNQHAPSTDPDRPNELPITWWRIGRMIRAARVSKRVNDNSRMWTRVRASSWCAWHIRATSNEGSTTQVTARPLLLAEPWLQQWRQRRRGRRRRWRRRRGRRRQGWRR